MKNLFSSPLKLLIAKLFVVSACLFFLGCKQEDIIAEATKSPECVEAGTSVEIVLSFPYPWDCPEFALGTLSTKEQKKSERCKKKRDKKLEKYTFEDINVNLVSVGPEIISSKDYSWDVKDNCLSFIIPESINPDDYDGFLDVTMAFTQDAIKDRRIGSDKSITFFWFATARFELPGEGLVAKDMSPQTNINTNPYQGNCGGGEKIELHRETYGAAFNTEEDGLRIWWEDIYLLPKYIHSKTENIVTIISQPGIDGLWIKITATNTPENHGTDVCDEDCDPCWDFLYKQEECIEPPEYTWDWKTDFACKGPCFVEIGNALENEEEFNDIILACQEANMVTIYEQDGTGNPAGRSGLKIDHTPLPGHPSALAVGLFDDNIYVDAAITLDETGDVIVFLNNGKGFENYTTYSVGDSPNDVVAADIDGDGESDIVVSNKGSNNLTILKGDADGNFNYTVWESIDLGKTPVAIIDGNFDNNYFPGRDIAVLLDDNSVAIYTGSEDQTLILMDEYTIEDPNIEGVDIESGNFWVDDYDGIAVLCKGVEIPSEIIFIEINVEGIYDYQFEGAESWGINSNDPLVFKCGAVYEENEYNDIVIGNSNGEIEVLIMNGRTVVETEELSISENGIKLSDIALGLLKQDDENLEDDLVVATSNYYLISKMNLGDSKGFKE